MVKNWCLDGTMEDTRNYPSPVPIIGLYTVGATLVCLSLILFDVFAGYRCRKSWSPSRFFALNSVTLTLTSISTKVPVDLTTPMPSAQDQLSKLTGTIFICMSMGFFMPSLGTNRQLECYLNLVALTIFLFTVAIDVCIQMATGVIFAFIVEHCIVLFCMLVMLVTFWLSAYYTNLKKDASVDQNKNSITKGERSMLQRLKVCYLYAYDINPQFDLCKNPYCGVVCLLCTICAVVLAEVVLGSLVFEDSKFCRGVSDYRWSMWLVVVTQILTVWIVSDVIVIRWLTFAGHIDQNVAALVLKLVSETSKSWMCKDPDGRETDEFKDLLEKHNVVVEEWVLREGVENMESWISMNKNQCPHLTQLLSTSPSQESHLGNLEGQSILSTGNEVSSHTILILVDIARVSLPTSLGQSLSEVSEEIFEIIYFIDSKINLSLNQKLRSMYANVHWNCGIAIKVLLYNFVKRSRYSKLHSLTELDKALGIIREYRDSVFIDVVRDEANHIVNFILSHSHTSLEDLSDRVKELFVDVLHGFLSKIPEVVYNHIAESPVEEYEDKVRLGLRFICKLEQLEAHVAWSYPRGSDINSFIDSHVSDVERC